jgi:YD repeat-containing protein
MIMFCLLSLFKGYGQKAPTIIPPSPQAQAFMRYGEVPVDYSTGVPGISIPLYTVKGRKLEVPISLSYHASGIKVQDVASDVGLGWVLNCGGLIARTTFGKPDEVYQSSQYWYKNSDKIYRALNKALSYKEADGFLFPGVPAYTLPLLNNFEDSLRTWVRDIDSQSDRFYYSLPNGTSGVFRYDFVTNEVVKLPYRPLKIEKEVSTNTSVIYIKQIKITDENGTIYTFQPSPVFDVRTSGTDFYLRKMESSDGTDVIEFEYEEPQGQLGSVSFSQTFKGPDEVLVGVDMDTCVNPFCEKYNTSVSYNFEPLRIKKITTPLTTVNFVYDTNARQDFNYLHRLKNINIVANSGGSIIKTINFSPRYFGSGNSSRLGLDSVIISSVGNTNPEKYSFQYQSNTLPEYETANGTFYEDYWGYNNNSYSASLVPGEFVPNSYLNYSGYYGNRNAETSTDQSFAKACMLKEIKYPTGGHTTFNFERNYYGNLYVDRATNQGGYVGGFRVKSIVNYDENNITVNTKTYEYGRAWIRQVEKNLFAINIKTYRAYCNRVHPLIQNYTIFSNSLLPLEVATGLQIAYQTVTEYNGTKENNTGKTVYIYKQPFSPNDYEDNPQHNFEYEEPIYFHPFHYDRGNYSPELLSKTEYSFNGTYHPVSKTVNTYTTLNKGEFNTGIHLVRLIDYSVIDRDAMKYADPDEYSNSIKAFDTKAYQEISLLTGTDNYTYDPTDSTKYIVNSTHLEYDSTYTQLTKQTVSTSVSGKNKETYFTHPYHYSSQAPYSGMVQMNNVSPVIEESSYMGGVFTQSVRTNYAYWKKDESVVSQSGSLYLEVDAYTSASSAFTITGSSQITINLYLEFCNGSFTLSISGPTSYSKSYSATGCGSTYSSGACQTTCTQNLQETVTLLPGSYTITFSHNNNENLIASYSATANYEVVSPIVKHVTSVSSQSTPMIYPLSVDTKTGTNPYETQLNFNNYDGNGNVVSFAQKDGVKEIYIWSYNGNYPVAKIINGNYSTIESALGGADALKNFFNTSAPSDEYVRNFLAPLRNYSSTSVYIYTYKPLVGMTSMTDPRGVTTYYEYDTAGRLKEAYMIANSVKKILQTYNYHYKNQ